MLFTLLLCFSFIVQAPSEGPPDPPQSVHVEKWLLTWTPAPQQTDVNFTVQYRNSDKARWRDVPACVQISSNECKVTLAAAADEQGCMMLRVRAHRRGLMSEPVEACSRFGSVCTPEIRLSAQPGSLTVHLMKNHSLAAYHGDHAKHRVFYAREGEPFTRYKDKVSSVTLPGLLEGQRYCVQTQYLLYNRPVGPRSCVSCQLVPESNQQIKPWIIVVVVLLGVPALLTPVIVYLFMYRCGRFKRWLRGNRYSIPAHFFQDLSREGHVRVPTNIPEERYDAVTICPRGSLSSD